MLKLRSRASQRYKCPKHPRLHYDGTGAIPSACDACHAIDGIVKAQQQLDQAERKAANWIAQTALGAGTGGTR